MVMVIWSGNLTHASSFQLTFQVEGALCEQLDTSDAQKTHPFQTLVCPFGVFEAFQCDKWQTINQL